MNTQAQVNETFERQFPKEIISRLFTVEIISEDQIRNENREYNPREWDKVIDRYSKYSPIFYKVSPQGGYDYTRCFAEYKSDGINFFKSVCYSSSLSSGGFSKIVILNNIAYRFLVKDINGNIGRIANNHFNRNVMRRDNDSLYSNEF